MPLVGGLSKKKKEREIAHYIILWVRLRDLSDPLFVLHWHWPTWAPRVPKIKAGR